MELSPYVDGLRRELSSLTRFASDDVVQVVNRLGEAIDSSVRLMLLDVLSSAAAEITTRLDDTVIDVRLSAGEPDFVVTAVPPAHDPPAAGEPGQRGRGGRHRPGDPAAVRGAEDQSRDAGRGRRAVGELVARARGDQGAGTVPARPATAVALRRRPADHRLRPQLAAVSS